MPRAKPLVVDLDGTLIRGDLFVEGILRMIFANPLYIFSFLALLLTGRARAKSALARQSPCDPATLPYNESLLAWLRAERASGRHLALATASDAAEAQAVADHLGLFDAVFASDGVTNLKARRKAQRLAEHYPQGFVYCGNERADLAVWSAAKAAVLVDTPRSVARRVSVDVERQFAHPPAPQAWLKAIRPQQWAKNALIFLPMMLGHGWNDPDAWRNCLLAFVALSATASSVYLVNDAADIGADRRHARKRRRPFASGQLRPERGLALSMALFLAGLGMSYAVGVIELVLLYAATSSLYTFWLKRKMLVDVFVLASLYMLRILIGGVAADPIGHAYLASSWLLAFSCFFFLSLALVKRVIEVDAVAAAGGFDLDRRGYRASDSPILRSLGIASGMSGSLMLALYSRDEAIMSRYQEPELLWLLPALVMYWQMRIWIMTGRGEVHDDPLVFALTDRISWVVGACLVLALAAALLLPTDVIPWLKA